MSSHERMRLRTAALSAAAHYPGPVGELLAREIWAWEEFGHRMAADGLMSRLVAHILDRS
ncbi:MULTISPECIES: hypothetical protein [Pseudonocardia]|jgi:hypothetical protein|nr:MULTISPECIES: hypothetical protein [unclassified Pseudonocardia]MCM3847704.1 hypothetical protein [Pseudonocardia sp. DR1-2]